LWNAATSATTRDLEERDSRIRKLEEEMAEHDALLKRAIEFAFELPPVQPGTEISLGPQAAERLRPRIRQELKGMSRAELMELEKQLRAKRRK
jgi:hypothetical protein